MTDKIEVRNARVNNLKGITLDIPRDRFISSTGISPFKVKRLFSG